MQIPRVGEWKSPAKEPVGRENPEDENPYDEKYVFRFLDQMK